MAHALCDVHIRCCLLLWLADYAQEHNGDEVDARCSNIDTIIWFAFYSIGALYWSVSQICCTVLTTHLLWGEACCDQFNVASCRIALRTSGWMANIRLSTRSVWEKWDMWYRAITCPRGAGSRYGRRNFRHCCNSHAFSGTGGGGEAKTFSSRSSHWAMLKRCIRDSMQLMESDSVVTTGYSPSRTALLIHGMEQRGTSYEYSVLNWKSIWMDKMVRLFNNAWYAW